MQHGFRGTVVSHAALVHDQDGIIPVQMGKAVRDGNDDAAFRTGDFMQEEHDIVFRPGIQSGRHLIANQQPGIGYQFHGQRQAPFLAAGKNFHIPVRNPLHSRYLQGIVNAVVQIVHGIEPATEPGGALHILIHAQLVIGNAELGNEPDFRRFKVFFSQIMAIPEKTPARFRNHARNRLQ